VQSGRGSSSGSRISGFRKKREQGLGDSTHEVVKCETRGGESEPLNPGTGGLLDQNLRGDIVYREFEGSRGRSMKARRPNSQGGERQEVQKGSQTIADFCVSKVHEVGARRLDAPTREVARCEKCEKEVKPSLTFTSRRFAR
jgi:hypothetical protein